MTDTELEPVVQITLPVPPSANRYWRHAKGRTYVSADALAYRHTVQCWWWAKTGRVMQQGDVVVEVGWYREAKRGDLDNRIKQLFDALRGLAWVDDKQVACYLTYRLDTEPERPRVDVTVWALGGSESDPTGVDLGRSRMIAAISKLRQSRPTSQPKHLRKRARPR